jgi:hypothetical protein
LEEARVNEAKNRAIAQAEYDNQKAIEEANKSR